MESLKETVCEECKYADSQCNCGEASEYVCECEHAEMEDCELIYDVEEFNSGVDSVSKLCGQVYALHNVGLSNEEIIQLITLQNSLEVEKETREHELKIATINSNMTIECEKIKAESLEISELIAEN